MVCGDAGSDLLVGGIGDDRLYGGDNGLVPSSRASPSPTATPSCRGPATTSSTSASTRCCADGYNSPDTIDYSASATGVAVDLVSRVATGEGTDTVVVAQPSPRSAPSSSSSAPRTPTSSSARKAPTSSSARAAATTSGAAAETTS